MAKIWRLFREYGFVRFVLIGLDGIVYLINEFFRYKLYRWTRDNYGFKEALFWSKDIALYLRYSRVLTELRDLILESNKKIRILEVGAGGDGISRFLKYSGDYEKCDIYLADKNPEALRNVRLANTIEVKGDYLPFENSRFDAVICLAALEHIPKDKREGFLKELTRVCGGTMLLYTVMNDPGKQFEGRAADLKFQQWHMKYFKKPHLWTAEHLQIESPGYREIKTALPNSSITGTQNVETWFKYMTFRAKPILGFFTGFLYTLKWKNKDNSPPFYGCFVKWVK